MRGEYREAERLLVLADDARLVGTAVAGAGAALDHSPAEAAGGVSDRDRPAGALDRCEQARETLDREGLVLENRYHRHVAHPCVAIERDSRLAAVRIFRDLGLENAPELTGPGCPPPPTLMRRIEARIGELLGEREKGGRGKKLTGAAVSFPNDQRIEFRKLADAVRRGDLRYEA